MLTLTQLRILPLPLLPLFNMSAQPLPLLPRPPATPPRPPPEPHEAPPGQPAIPPHPPRCPPTPCFHRHQIPFPAQPVPSKSPATDAGPPPAAGSMPHAKLSGKSTSSATTAR